MNPETLTHIAKVISSRFVGSIFPQTSPCYSDDPTNLNKCVFEHTKRASSLPSEYQIYVNLTFKMRG